MTRINCVPAGELADQHLMAEYYEIGRVAHCRKVGPVPESYRLGAGHMRFFLDKGRYLAKRKWQLYCELKRRHFRVEWRPYPIEQHPWGYRRDWRPSLADLQLNRSRLAERISANPHRFTWR